MNELFFNIKKALKQNLIPGICLQIFALLLAYCYFNWDASRPIFDAVAGLKSEHGWRYSVISTSIFGGLIPFIYLLYTKQVRQAWLPVFIFYIVYWGFKGLEVDIVYYLQASWFGTGNDWATLIKKTCVDQFIYSTFWAVPAMTIPYLWKESGFNLRKTFRKLDREFFTMTIPTTLMTNWIIWFPAVLVIYAMPAALQIPLFNLVLCFFVLLLSTITRDNTPDVYDDSEVQPV